LQTQYPQYSKHAAAKSFVDRAIQRFWESEDMPTLDPFRDLCGENKSVIKRKNPQIFDLCDEILSEPKVKAPKV